MIDATGIVFNIQGYSIQDGPGIRTTVFLKGCPLKCAWCSNPESQEPNPELAHSNTLCDKCGKCLDSCSRGAITVVARGISVDRLACNNCAKCVASCPRGALKIYGELMTAADTFEKVARDEPFYRRSGGGVTVSGGEPLQQHSFVAQLFSRCRSAGIATALDTCGYAGSAALDAVLPLTDLVLFDLKLYDPDEHLRWTGKRNSVILRNFKRIVASGVPMRIRIPLIPGVTSTTANISALGNFMSKLGRLPVDFMPYHRFGTGKYEMLDLEYQLKEAEHLADDELLSLKQEVESFALECTIVR